MTVPIDEALHRVDWVRAKADLTADDFDNGRSADALRRSFEQSTHVALAWDGEHLVGMARLLSDGVCNAYLVDVWTHSAHRRRGIGSALVEHLVAKVPGQHVGLQSDDAGAFYAALGFRHQPEFLSRVSGTWLANNVSEALRPPTGREPSQTSLCVFCGSSPGADPAFVDAAAALGRLVAERGLRLVYGGAHVGTMGALADAALAAGGEVHGVITRALESKEIVHRGLTELTIVDTMHERKAAMADRADAFVMLPGGFGTLDEFFEAVTWTQLGIHRKPAGVLDVLGYFQPLVALLQTAVDQRFVAGEHRDLVLVDTDPGALLDRLARWRPTARDTWLDRSQR